MSEKVTFDDSSWSGAASNWETAAAYCRDCLIDLNPSGAEKTKDKCKLPYRKPGSAAINKGALRAIASGARGLSATSAPAEEKRKAANFLIRVWPGAFGQAAPEGIYRIAGKERPKQKLLFYKDRSNATWFVGIYSNNFEDREGEIISWAAHEDFAQWVSQKGVELPIVMLHQPQFPPDFHKLHLLALESGTITPAQYSANLQKLYKPTTIAVAKAVIPLKGFMLVIGKVLPERLGLANRIKAGADTWGMSHGFVKMKCDGNIINKYRSFEFTIAPDEWAANMFTPIGFSEDKELMGDEIKLSEEHRAIIEAALSANSDELEEKAEEVREMLRSLVNSKTLTEEGEDSENEELENEDETEDEGAYAALRSKIFSDLQVDELMSTLQEAGQLLQQQGTQIKALQEAVQMLKRDEDEVISGAWTGPDWTLGFNAQEPGEQGDEDADLVDRLKEDKDRKIVDKMAADREWNPLQHGVWNHLLPKENK